MFDVSQIAKRYFDIRLIVEDEEGTHPVELKLEPPTVNQLNNLASVSKADPADAIPELRDAVQSILSKNKTGLKVPADYVEKLDFDQLVGILTAYMSWVNKEKQEKN